MYLFWNSILFHLLLDDGEQAYGREIFLGSKLKPHYYYYLLKPNCRNSMIPSAHILQSPDKSHFAVPVSFVKRSKPPKSTYILITVSWAASWSSSHSCHRAVYCQLQHDHQNHCSRHGVVFKPHRCGKKTHGVGWKHTWCLGKPAFPCSVLPSQLHLTPQLFKLLCSSGIYRFPVTKSPVQGLWLFNFAAELSAAGCVTWLLASAVSQHSAEQPKPCPGSTLSTLLQEVILIISEHRLLERGKAGVNLKH